MRASWLETWNGRLRFAANSAGTGPCCVLAREYAGFSCQLAEGSGMQMTESDADPSHSGSTTAAPTFQTIHGYPSPAPARRSPAAYFSRARPAHGRQSLPSLRATTDLSGQTGAASLGQPGTRPPQFYGQPGRFLCPSPQSQLPAPQPGAQQSARRHRQVRRRYFPSTCLARAAGQRQWPA